MTPGSENQQVVPGPHPDDAPIFVVGTGRSGTTLMRQMLNAHPRIHLTHEGFFYAYSRFAGLQRSANAWLDRYFGTYSFAWMRLDPDEVRNEVPDNLPLKRIREAFLAVMRCKARQLGKPRYGEKSPLDVAFLGRIFSDFPDPRVIYMMRDPRATVASLDRMPFAAPSTLVNSILCAQQYKMLKIHQTRVHEVRLEDLIAAPREVMQQVLEFLGEPWDEAVLDHTAHAPNDDLPPLPWFDSARKKKVGPDPGSPSWKAQLGPAWIRTIERINREGMVHHGYKPLEMAREPGRTRQVLVQLGDVPAVWLSGWRAWRMGRRIKAHFSGKKDYDPQRAMEDQFNLNRKAWKLYPGFVMPRVPRP